MGRKKEYVALGRAACSRQRKVINTKGLNLGFKLNFFSHSILGLTQIMQPSIAMKSLELSSYIEREVNEMTGFNY